jgi:hypothetical protein
MNVRLKKAAPLLLILLLAVVLFVVRQCQAPADKNPAVTPKKTTGADPASEANRNRGFDRRTSFIEYTAHAKCRMSCRHITQAEVEQIMRDGKINYNKSNVNARPCPEYALEGTTADNQRVRIVFAQCDYKTKVVTTIDLGAEWQCECPGDDKKHQNK